jgi:tripartite-type tricarboxylate transporter receptor subunit TctC
MIGKHALLLALAAIGFSTVGASAQPYPQRPIKIIVDRPAGVPHDLLTRALADKLSASLKQTIVVDNRTGAGGNLAAEYVSRATPDGYTLLVSLDTTLTVNPTLYKNLSFDPSSDLRPLSIMAISSNMLVVHPSIPVNSLAEFVTYAKTNPITYAHGGNGSPGHLAMEYFRMQAGFPAVPVPYRGNAQLVIDLVAGQIKFGLVGTGGVIEHVHAGRLKALAISAAKRAASAPNVPTIAESGYPDFKVEPYFVISAPAGVPEPIAVQLEREVRNALQSPGLQEWFRAQNFEMAATTGDEAKTRIKADTRLWAEVIKATGMHIN